MSDLLKSLKILKDLRFPLDRGPMSSAKFLEKYYSEYSDKLSRISILSDGDRNIIDTMCKGITECFHKYDKQSIKEAYDVFYSNMNSIKNSLPYSYIESGEDSIYEYYRILSSSESEYNYKELLHIPYDKRQHASQNRFSLPGIPCTYMASNPTLSWYECGIPKQFSIGRYSVNKREYGKHKMLRLNYNYLWLIHGLEIRMLIVKTDEQVYKEVRDLCIITPLIAACSLIAKNKDSGFIEEYLIPQMLLSWVRQDQEFIGIRYNSACSFEEARHYIAHNIVIPATSYDIDGYCSFLKTLFDVNGKNKVEYINTVKQLKSILEEIGTVEQYYTGIKYEYQIANVVVPYKDILSICGTLFYCLRCIQENYEGTSSIAFKTIKSLYMYSLSTIEKLQCLYGKDYSSFYVEDDNHRLTNQIKERVRDNLERYNKTIHDKVLLSMNNFDFIKLFDL